MCKTPSGEPAHRPSGRVPGHGSLAAAWTRSRDASPCSRSGIPQGRNPAARSPPTAGHIPEGGRHTASPARGERREPRGGRRPLGPRRPADGGRLRRGGSRDDSLATVGLAAVVAAALGLGAALLGFLPLRRLDRAGALVLGASIGLTVWAGVSIAWSIAGDRSWEWLGRGIVYMAFLVLGLLAGAFVDGARRVAAIAAAVVGAALALGAPRRRDPVARGGGGSNSEAAGAGRVLERPRAAGRRRHRARPVGHGLDTPCDTACRRPARVRGRSRAPAHPVAGRNRRGRRRRGALAPAVRGTGDRDPSPPGGGRSGPRRRRMGLHAPGARREPRSARGSCLGRQGLRRPHARRRAPRRRDPLACARRAPRARA